MTKSKRKISSGMNAEGFETLTVPTRPYFSNVSFLRLYSHWKYALTWQAMALKEIESKGAPDVIVVSSPPLYTGSVARRIAKKTGAKVIVDVMDAWPETFARIVPEMLLFPLKVLARKNYLCADAVTAVSDRYVSLLAKYGRREKVARFYHGIEIPLDGKDIQDENAAGNAARLVYAGNLGVTYDLETVLHAIVLAKKDGVELSLDIAGKGSRIEAIRSLVNELALQNCVRIHGYLGAEELSSLLESCDIGIIPMPSDSFVGVPYKLADYAKANLPCVSSLGGEVTALLEKYSCGATYKEGDAVSFLDAVKKILPKMAEAKKGARDMANQEFDAKKIYAEYVLFAEKIVSMKDRRKVL
jgi:glycosyltransferase involved in cell wall biosynthesis